MTTEQANASLHRPRRRWLRFSLRTVLVLVALAAIFPARALYRTERQRLAVAHVLSVGGEVTYDHQMVDGKGYVADAPPPGPKWLVDFVGVDLVATVRYVDVGTLSAKDVLTDDDLRFVEVLSQAKSLGVRYSKWITDDGMISISRFRNLEELVLDGLTGTTDECLVHASGLKHLRQFQALRMPWAGAGCAYIANLPLEEVNLYQSSVTDECLRHIGRIRTLKKLYLGETKITDAGMAHLIALENLEELNIGNERVGDEGVKHLLGLKKLREIQAFKTNITAASAALLAAALPRCYITTDFGAHEKDGQIWAWHMFDKTANSRDQ